MMKKYLIFFTWFNSFWKRLWKRKSENITNETESPRFRLEYVEDVPSLISDKSIFIVQDGNEPELLAFKCPCGCDANIILNLLKDASPRWRFEINGDDIINIYPSVWRKFGCKSHFFVTKGDIKWV